MVIIRGNKVFLHMIAYKFILHGTLTFVFRSVGGIRVSMYNAVKLDDVKTLVDFMKDFRQRNQKQ